jgi:hypothetical protein
VVPEILWGQAYPTVLTALLPPIEIGQTIRTQHRSLQMEQLLRRRCRQRSPWQKGGVENAIGRLRRRLPRKTDLAGLSSHQIASIVRTYNDTPRKCLDAERQSRSSSARSPRLGSVSEAGLRFRSLWLVPRVRYLVFPSCLSIRRSVHFVSKALPKSEPRSRSGY